MSETLTAVFEKIEHGYTGYIEELPGVNTQGKNARQDQTKPRRSPRTRSASQP